MGAGHFVDKILYLERTKEELYPSRNLDIFKEWIRWITSQFQSIDKSVYDHLQ